MVVNILALIVVLGILVVLHEGGHFLAARAASARVSVFSLGFGRRLFGRERGGTDYRVSLIPLGGYVRIHGLGPDESDIVGADAQPADPLLPKARRAFILAAGPVANIVGAIAFLALAFVAGVQVPAYQDQAPQVAWVDPASPAASAGMREGDLVLSVDGAAMENWRDLEMATLSAPGRALQVRYRRNGSEAEVTLTPKAVSRFELGYAGLAPAIPAIIQGVQDSSPAQRAGIRAGDRIVAINGEPVRHFYDLMKLVGANPGREIAVAIERQGAPVELRATPRDVGGVGKLGIPIPNPLVVKRLSVPAAIGEAVRENWKLTRETFAVIGRMFTGRASLKQMSGPIDIARISGETARTGIVPFIWLLGVISLQLAIFNLLPIPVLDGGHLAIMAVETVIRHDFAETTKERILNIGFWLIIALVVVILFNDVTKTALFGRFFPSKTP